MTLLMKSRAAMTMRATKMPFFHRWTNQNSEGKQKLGGWIKWETRKVARRIAPRKTRVPVTVHLPRGAKASLRMALKVDSRPKRSWM
jgi:hypothetical protein